MSKSFSFLTLISAENLKYFSLLLVVPLIYFFFNFEKKLGVISKKDFNDETLRKKKLYSLFLILIGLLLLLLSFLFFKNSFKEGNSYLFLFLLLFSLLLGLISLSSGLWHFIASFLESKTAMIKGGLILFLISFLIIASFYLYFRVVFLKNLSPQSQIPSFFAYFGALLALLALSMIGASFAIIIKAIKKQ